MITFDAPTRPRTPCPTCGEAAGVPCGSITAPGGAITLHLYCSGCERVWSVTLDAEAWLNACDVPVRAKPRVIH